MAEHDDLGPYLLGALGPSERSAFEAHLEDCEDCDEEVRTLGPAVRALDRMADIEPSRDLRKRTMAAVHSGGSVLRPSFWRRAVPVLAVAAVAVISVAIVRQAPEGELFTLVSPDGGPARGTARVRDVPGGREVTLDVEGLPPPPGGVYECWFVGEGDTLEEPNRMSAGTFRTDAEGKAHVVMVAAADPDRFPNMGVTLESDGGNPQRMGPKVLVTQG